MQIFINETSLNSQFNDTPGFNTSLLKFIAAIKRISEIANDKEIFKSDLMYYYSGVEGTYLETALKANHTLRTAFVQNLQLLNPKSWQKQQAHNNESSYEFSQFNYVGTSVAELAERKNHNGGMFGFLLNFSDSQFGSEAKIQILKDGNISIDIDCTVDNDSIEQWLIDNNFIDPNEIYDENSNIAPSDIQTVLRDNTIFEKTNYPRNNGRIVYRRIGTNELWAVDNSRRHASPKAHIEVFDEKTAKHLGTSLYNECELNTSFKVNKRKINLGNSQN
jgi:hypothetical protein